MENNFHMFNWTTFSLCDATTLVPKISQDIFNGNFAVLIKHIKPYFLTRWNGLSSWQSTKIIDAPRVLAVFFFSKVIVQESRKQQAWEKARKSAETKLKYATSHEISRVYSYNSCAQTCYGTWFGTLLPRDPRSKVKKYIYLKFHNTIPVLF